MTREELNKICEWLDANITCMQNNTRMFFIERFRKAMDAVVKEPLTWHKASEELPKEDGIYLVLCGKSLYTTVIEYTASPRYWHIIGYQSDVRYWMPIPELPKED